MAASYRQGFVFVQNVFSGIIRETDSGYEFEYDKEYLTSQNPLAVSLTLPLQEEIFESKTLFPFFDGLIPEGWHISPKELIGNPLKMARNFLRWKIFVSFLNA